MIREAVIRLADRQDIGYETAKQVMCEIMRNEVTEVQKAAYLTALAMKGETAEEIAGSAEAMRENCVRFLNDQDVLEIVGTGGDYSNSFNISSTSAIVIASGGVPVAKHGRRAVSSASGAADLYEALGINIRLEPRRAAELLRDIGIVFLFSQNYHIAMRYVAPVRKELGIRTVFDMIGPLANPAGADMLLLGVSDEGLVKPLGEALLNLGVKKAMVVYGRDRLDEISVSAPTAVCEVCGGKTRCFEIRPEDFGLERCHREDLLGGSADHNAEICRRIVSGRERGPKRDAVVINAGAAFCLAGKVQDIGSGVRLAEELIDSGAAMAKLEEFIVRSNR